MESEDIDQTNFATTKWEDTWFRYCNFSGFSMEGGHITSDFVGCSFKEIDLYWTMFNIVNFIDCKFYDCVFRGVSFPDCRFVECKLVNCRFIKDNLNGDCGFVETVAYGCTIDGCEGFVALIVGDPRNTATVFSTSDTKA